jgi:hypothetical protein
MKLEKAGTEINSNSKKNPNKENNEILCYEELDGFSGKLETSPAALMSFMVGQEKSVNFLFYWNFFPIL